MGRWDGDYYEKKDVLLKFQIDTIMKNIIMLICLTLLQNNDVGALVCLWMPCDNS
jgi:hypothetical protein